MSIIQLKRIERILEKQVVEHIDPEEIRSEKKNIQEEELQNIILSRSYLLYALKNLTGEPYSNLKKSITDGFQDNGLDAVYYSHSKNQLFICQSKWIKNGNGGVDKGEILKFVNGITDLLHLNYADFNDKLKQHSELIEEAIYGPNIKIRIILAYSGNKISDENKSLITDKVDEFNDTDEDIFFEEYNLKNAYSDLKDAVDGEPINAELDLLHWGYSSEPFKAYYGTVNCGHIAELLDSASSRIYSKNIRSFVGLSTINNEIINTLVKNPENFFYLNNGIVLLCKEIKKSKYNSGKRESGKFHLTDLTVVNGAQTVGAINYAFNKQPEKVNLAQVFIKIISLEDTPEHFDKQITIASNTQNKIEKRDFVSLDKQQKRLIHDFYLNGLKYHTKRDDKELIKNDENFYFEEATISLACFQDDIDFSTYAKREIGKL
ncbi:AIPR protein [Gillisia mitskevichiae]|uniref:AIPR protein n=1 Tax=Gillisia mitskevichiae TaxID=270921 RepID=A0A495P1M0_9FLAO|nr:AIPR family protein [Gillisia mitskevichiae]RKS42559.1 AIPR protein [Gillisia mitskevichiae]